MAKTVDKILGLTILLALMAALPLGFSVGHTEILAGIPGYIVALVIVGVVLLLILMRAILEQIVGVVNRVGLKADDEGGYAAGRQLSGGRRSSSADNP